MRCPPGELRSDAGEFGGKREKGVEEEEERRGVGVTLATGRRLSGDWTKSSGRLGATGVISVHFGEGEERDAHLGGEEERVERDERLLKS
jgi:hypothetical protein